MGIHFRRSSSQNELFLTLGWYFHELLWKGMVSEIAEEEDSMRKKLLEVAHKIAEKSPVAIWTIKSALNRQRHQILLPNLDYMARMNASMA